MNRIKDLDHLLVESLRVAEMRQGCTNHTYFAEILRKQILELFPQPLDDKELREKALLTDEEIEDAIRGLLTFVTGDRPGGFIGNTLYRDSRTEKRAIADKATDKAVALLQQRVEAKHRKHGLSMKGRVNPQLKEWNESHRGITWTGRKHTDETREKMSQARKGSDNPHWKGGLSELVKGIRRSPEYHQWRKAVLERDNHTCQDCKGTKELDAHHIQSIFDYPEGVFEIDNGLTLCKDCHKRHTWWRGLRPKRKGDRSAKVKN